MSLPISEESQRWAALVARADRAERALEGIRDTLLAHGSTSDEDLRWWLERVAERIDREMGAASHATSPSERQSNG